MGQVIAVANQKGGVGKTTTVVSLGVCLAELGQRVLVMDLDPQANLTVGLGVDLEGLDRTMYDVLRQPPIELADVLIPSNGLFVAPSGEDMSAIDLELVNRFSREKVLRKALAPYRDQYDYILIDCPPTLHLLTVNAMVASDAVIIPVECEYYALFGIRQLLATIWRAREENEDLRILGVLLTKYDARTNLGREVIAQVRERFGADVFETIIGRDIKLAESPASGKAILQYAARSGAAAEYRQLAREVMERVCR
ncbi:MAG TPA: AAA family ATPase [Dehalococcoidia bacterium]|nr:AAA family ATPase [Dehalococcoidia bacterium]